MKRFISGIILGFIISTAAYSFAAGNWENISVLRNDITVVVDGETISSDNFLYNDTTYLPLRTISNALGKSVEYDETSNTAYIGERKDELLNTNNIPSSEALSTNMIEVVNGTYYLSVEAIDLYYFKDTNNKIELEFDESNNVFFIFTLADGTTKTLPTTYIETIGRSCITYDTFVEEIMPHM